MTKHFDFSKYNYGKPRMSEEEFEDLYYFLERYANKAEYVHIYVYFNDYTIMNLYSENVRLNVDRLALELDYGNSKEKRRKLDIDYIYLFNCSYWTCREDNEVILDLELGYYLQKSDDCRY